MKEGINMKNMKKALSILSDSHVMTCSDHAGILLDFDFDGGLSFVESEYSKNY